MAVFTHSFALKANVSRVIQLLGSVRENSERALLALQPQKCFILFIVFTCTLFLHLGLKFWIQIKEYQMKSRAQLVTGC